MNETPEGLGVTTRPWGIYNVLVDELTHKVKSIIVLAGKRISLQSHKRRKEFWTIVNGVGLLTTGFHLDELETILVTVGDTVEIPTGMIHRIEAGTTDLKFIEVQIGAYFGEDDIKRFEDDFGR